MAPGICKFSDRVTKRVRNNKEGHILQYSLKSYQCSQVKIVWLSFCFHLSEAARETWLPSFHSISIVGHTLEKG